MSLINLESVVKHILHSDTSLAEYSGTILGFAESTQRNCLLRHAIEKRLKTEKTDDLEYLRAYFSILINPASAKKIVNRLEERPNHPELLPSKLTLKADCLIALGEYAPAEHYLKQSLVAPINWRPCVSYAKLRMLQNNLEGLEGRLEDFSIMFPQALQITLLRMDLLIRLRRLNEAIRVGQEALSVLGEQPRIYSAISSCLIDQGKADESIEYLVYSLSLDPNDAYCLAVFGDALASLNKHIEAIHLYEKGLELRKWSSLYDRIGKQLAILQRSDLAIIAFSQGLAIDKNSPDLWVNTAHAFAACGEQQVAIEILEKIYSKGPIPWELFCQTQFDLSIQGESALEKLSHYGHLYWSEVCKTPLIPEPKHMLSAKCKPLRLAFLSADIGDHVVGRFIKSILSAKLESFNVDIISTQRRFDVDSLDISLQAAHAYSTQGLSAQEATALIKSKNYSIVIDTNGYTRHTGIGLLSDRCAPIQCHYIGYHASTYAPFIDYFIADQVLVPKGFDAHFVENVYRLRRTWLALSTDFLPDPELIQQRSQRNQSIVFGSFSQAPKISDQTLEIWSSVLDRVPDSILVIKSISLTEPLKEKILTMLERTRILGSRVRFIAPTESYIDHLKLYNSIDIALDTTPWSSATTCFEALSMGVPLVALTGRTLSARMSTSVLNGGGLGAQATPSIDDYANICLQLSEEILMQNITKHGIRKQVEESELFDNRDLAMHLDSAFLDMHAKLLASQEETA
ncbi:glycosyltransferase family 41 protein [Synechococcus sp. CCY 0621]|uniref:O-linked N-acetylglucosamine transferase, SPINDLY family protein n=1 Tax=Synechococcus sp. CCY 0621 TaxID=2815603 RepID=UPI001C24E0B9|nr:glycosyltransferase family 41 protein [Synechococcus sp. CCY 0621]